MIPYITPLAIVVASYVLQKLFKFWRAKNAISNHPGFRTVFSERFVLLPRKVRGLTPGVNGSFFSKHAEFAKAGCDVLSAVDIVSGSLTYYVADAAVTSTVTAARARFPKPVHLLAFLSPFGPNMLITECAEWRRQRKVAAPAFSHRSERLVWDETIRIVGDMVAAWGKGDQVDVDHVMDITVPITLLVISSAGFGRRAPWNASSVPPAGHSVPFEKALDLVTHKLLYKLIFPDWVLRWGTRGMREFHTAFGELERYMREMIHERQTAEVKEERHDLFSSLLDANDLEKEGSGLSDSELMGNIFLFFAAGYETTAHTLAYALIFLALHQDEQEKLYAHIKSVVPTNRAPTYDDCKSLKYAEAVLYETLRLFPPIIEIAKQAAEDTSFSVSNAAGEHTLVPVPKGTYVVLCTPALHHNPRYWDDPTAFKPSRFLGDWPREAFLPFSGGPRACIGRGFAETEAVAVLTLLVSQFKIEIKNEAQFAGETVEQRKARVLKSKMGLTVYPERAPLVFSRR